MHMTKSTKMENRQQRRYSMCKDITNICNEYKQLHVFIYLCIYTYQWSEIAANKILHTQKLTYMHTQLLNNGGYWHSLTIHALTNILWLAKGEPI